MSDLPEPAGDGTPNRYVSSGRAAHFGVQRILAASEIKPPPDPDVQTLSRSELRTKFRDGTGFYPHPPAKATLWAFRAPFPPMRRPLPPSAGQGLDVSVPFYFFQCSRKK
jgi:hypothetical protein